MGNSGSTQPSKVRKDRKKDEADGTRYEPRKGSRKENVEYRGTNPFIIFFLRLRSKKPKEHVTVIARAAGKLWTQMTPEQRKKYIDLANAEKKRREGRRRKTRKSRRRKR
ncbi:uncharacterized protein LOC117226340 [Megalopta genalis]|uniref:uncharacterized protein LOC117226340 n=1 Tax=Megalopta genalis TaxID=115081 RepID=UPI0014434ACD|nr:protamine-like isoform X1 [Megalopta genalis]